MGTVQTVLGDLYVDDIGNHDDPVALLWPSLSFVTCRRFEASERPARPQRLAMRSVSVERQRTCLRGSTDSSSTSTYAGDVAGAPPTRTGGATRTWAAGAFGAIPE